MAVAPCCDIELADWGVVTGQECCCTDTTKQLRLQAHSKAIPHCRHLLVLVLVCVVSNV